MKLAAITETLALVIDTQGADLSRDVTGVYISDLLSDVLAHAEEGNLWVTLQGHPNVVAVASMKDIAAVVLVNGRKPEQETIQKAIDEAIPLLHTDLPAFELAGQLYRLIGGE